MTFWILIFALALLTTVFLCYSMLSTRRSDAPTASYDIRVYREQLASVDRDLARGVIAEADADRVRTEISRRILAADAQTQDHGSVAGPSKPVSIIAILVLGGVLVGGAVMLYRTLGAPGYGDLPLSWRLETASALRTERPLQAQAEAFAPQPPASTLDESYATLLGQLRETVASRPDDLQGQMLLAQHETNTGNFKAGYAAQQRVIALSGSAATAQNYADLAEMMILAAGGYVSPEAEEALQIALDRDPRHGPARYYWGQMLAQVGRPDIAYRVWQEVLRDAPAGAPWAQAIRDQIDDLAFRAGVFYAPSTPAPVAGPSQDDISAAGDMTADERQQMIQGMVSNLSDRLATEGGSAQEWAQLIGALGVLGETERAAAIHTEAQAVFAHDDNALGLINAAAQQAGITQ